MKLKMYSGRFDTEAIKWFTKYAKKTGRARDELLREAMNDAIAKYQKRLIAAKKR